MPTSLKNTRFFTDSALLSYWEFEGTSSNSKDTTIIGSDTNILYRDTSGRFGSGSLFNGSTSKIALSGNTGSLQPTGSFTITGWVRTTDAGNYMEILGTVTDNGTYYAGYEFRKSSANQLQFAVGNRTNTVTGTGLQSVNSSTAINTGNMFFLAGRYNGTNLQCFVNGLPDGASAAYSNNAVYETPPRTNQRIGCNNYASTTEIQFWSGSIDDLAIFNRALSDAEILEIYQSSSLFLPLNTSTWYSSSWAYRKYIVYSSSMAVGDNLNFPLLVSMSDSSLSSYANSDGSDILFTNYNGITKLAHELEYYNTGNIVAWVSVPIIYSGSSTGIYMYYGNPSAASQQNSSSVWDSSFTGVYHLNSSSKDSTINANNGTYTNNVTYTGSMVASGAYFNGTTSMITSSTTPQTANTNWTIEGWINTNNINQQGKAFHVGSPISGQDSGYAIGLGNGSGGNGALIEGLLSNVVFVNSGYTISANTPYYIVLLRNGANSMIYVNGIQYGATPANASVIPAGGFQIGREIPGRLFDGIVDEVRFTLSNRSDTWIKTTYLNIASSSLYTLSGPLESLTSQSINIKCSLISIDRLKGIDRIRFN